MTGIVARVIERSGWVIEAGEGGARSSAGSEITDALGGRIGTNGTEERQGYRNGNRHAHCTRVEGRGKFRERAAAFAQRGEHAFIDHPVSA